MKAWPGLRHWLGAPVAARPARWVVLDVESSGLDARRDRLIAVAGVAVHQEASRLQVSLGDSFETVLRQPEVEPDKPNILLHGIGVEAQRTGLAPQAALEALEAWLAGAPVVAFHAAFDETLIQRAMQAVLGRRLANAWVDLEPVAAALQPQVKARALDPWLAHFGIVCAARHRAAADALATAELLLRLWPLVLAQRIDTDFAALQKLAAQGRWLRR